MTPPNERIVVFEMPYSSGGFVVNKPARHAQCMLLYLVLHYIRLGLQVAIGVMKVIKRSAGGHCRSSKLDKKSHTV